MEEHIWRGFEWVSRVEGQVSGLNLPTRSTSYSAGYDFYCPETVTIPSHLQEMSQLTALVLQTNVHIKPFVLKLGVKAYMQPDEVLQVYLRSSTPDRYGLVMANSVGIIDCDYYNNIGNEGEIGLILYNLSNNPITISRGERIGQGIFTKFLMTYDDIVMTYKRTGGYGSTNNGIVDTEG